MNGRVPTARTPVVAIAPVLARLCIVLGKVHSRGRMWLYRALFRSHGKRFRFDVNGLYSYWNIRVGDDVNLGQRPILLASASRIDIGNKVMFGPEVCILGGNHTTTIVGKFMIDVTRAEKSPSDDRGVVIEDDVWVGARAVILDGVTIGRGAVVGAGAIVTRSVPPYAVVVGNPARVLRLRWDVETIKRHEAVLYPPERRLGEETVDGLARTTPARPGGRV